MAEGTKILTLRFLSVVFGLCFICGSCLGQQPQDTQSVFFQTTKFQRELKQRVNRDQLARIALNKSLARSKNNSNGIDQERHNRLVKKASETDGENLVWLKKIRSLHGLPRAEQLNGKTAEHFFLLVLHADRDPDFQRKFLDHLGTKSNGWPSRFEDLLKKRLLMVHGSTDLTPSPLGGSATVQPID